MVKKYEKMIPPSSSEEREACKGPLYSRCEACHYRRMCMDGKLKYYTQIPNFILEYYMKDLSYSAFKILVHLVRRAGFKEQDSNFGKCWPSYDDIEKFTGVSESNMRKYIKELVDAGLIERKQVPNRKANGKFVTRNYFTILWFKRMLELKNYEK